ncbi:hypothetical protein H8J79_09895 [Clostridium perfringens]|uniref:hypothetical protein n=1 Tax=Clostridium perfringens TaxID=1502 RepID=UPI0018E41ABF|nr:hypothetical protein [Clostridium perfringens]MBI6021122.1 hypothetical protein [Clostridium perfringens]MDZ5129606.1 hypothetical protein [Clostridium perfringens]
MGKKIMFPIVIIMLILGVLVSIFIKEDTSLKVKESEVVAMKYYMNKERNGNYHNVPKDLEKQSIEEVVSVLNENDFTEKKNFSPITDSNRKLYIFLKNSDVIVINNNSIDEEKYIVEYPNDSILGSSNKSKYMVINSERLKKVFLNIENSFNDVNGFEERMKV